MFELHPVLARDCESIGDLPLCRVLLMNDSQYPWLILVPRRPEITEVFRLAEDDQQQLLRESVAVSRVLTSLFSPDKLNIAALGNVVPQLHVHHIARFTADAAWPRPVWGVQPPQPYTDSECESLCQRLRAALRDCGLSFSAS